MSTRFSVIDINTWPPSIVIAFGLAPFVIGLSGMAMSAYIACTRDFEVMLRGFKNSKWLKQQVLTWGVARLRSRIYFVNTIGTAMLYPSFGIKKGLIEADEIRNFPKALKHRMVIAIVLIIAGSAWLFLGVVLINLSSVE